MLAESHEVAEHVKRLAGPILAERKALLAAARRQRIGSVPDGIATTIGVPSPLDGAAKVALAKPPPAEHDVTITVTEDSVPLPPLAPAIAGSDANDAGDASTTTRAVETSDAPRRASDDDAGALPEVSRRIPKVVLIGGGVSAGVLVAVLALTLKLAAGRDAEAAGAATSATAPTSEVTAPAVGPLAEGAPTASGTGAAKTEKAEEVASAQFLALSTNAPVAEVKVGDRVVDMVIAAPNVSVELEPEETQRALVVTVKSADGRVATKTLARGELEAKIAFPAARGASPPQAPKAAPGTRNGKPPRHL